ncbi:hypothetical protein L195_g027100 [Trifolium pratense]|uniref:Uncharacterized protein n=1 Tax=Trifolium pratense TaxID=57577 RepID=A0A2K3KY70_TRIPR|nr:hypothetical protein L195_g027100 [Trifolium pratense]
MMVSYTRNKDYDTMEDEIDANTESRPYVDGLDIPLQDNEWDQWSHSWEKTLIVTLMGKRANFKILEKKQWTKNGKVKLVDMEDGYFQERLITFMLCTRGLGCLRITISSSKGGGRCSFKALQP